MAPCIPDLTGSCSPTSVLVCVLGRLPPRSLAASRCVCKAWRDIVDDCRLLLTHLLPHSLRGIFANYDNPPYPDFFSSPSTGSAICSKLGFVPADCYSTIDDHCNGLLLYGGGEYVVNPATRQWAPAPAPPCPRMPKAFGFFERLVFDPTV